MKICAPHWDALKVALDQRGLSHLIAKGEEACAQRTAAAVNGDDSNANYDPLLAANFAIWSNAIEVFGLGIVGGEICPLCELDAHIARCTNSNCKNKDTGSDWIGFAADGQLDVARARGLVSQAN